MSPSSALLTVDLDALAHNYRAVKAAAGGAEVAPAVKADGYGLGAPELACRLWAEGARSFFIARLDEGETLRAALGEARPATIYLLDGAAPGWGPRILAAGLVPCLSSLEQIDAFAAFAAEIGRTLEAAIHIDTGMNRLGVRPEEARALAAGPERLTGLDIGLVMSHLACGDEPDHPLNRAQLETFRALRPLFPAARASFANSAGVFLGEDYHFDMVRPGISLYGGGPFARTDERLRPVALFEAPVLQVRHVPPGETVGYGAAYRTTQPMRLAIIAAGHADGVLRAFHPNGYAWCKGAMRRMVGRVSMDLIAIDVTEADDIRPGDTMELLGAHVTLDDAAAAGGTVAYECLVRLSGRARRVFVEAEIGGEPEPAAA